LQDYNPSQARKEQHRTAERPHPALWARILPEYARHPAGIVINRESYCNQGPVCVTVDPYAFSLDAAPSDPTKHYLQHIVAPRDRIGSVWRIIPAKPHGWSGLALTAFENLSAQDQARSKRSAFITLVHAATKSATNFASASSAP
jgi:hypothetical protein